jgi:hypothetical protein
MSRVCGRCRGRGFVKPTIGFGDQNCPACKGTGVKVQKSSLGTRTVSVPLSGASCKVCGNPAVNSHHVISQSRLKRYLPANEAREAQADIRNTTPLCFDCHEKAESGRLELAPHELHPGFLRFVEQYDLAAALPRYLSERLAA